MMSLPDFHSVLKGKRDSGQPKTTNCSLAPSPLMPEHEFVELLWENGHVVMQGQSNRNKKGSFPNDFPSLSGKAKEEEAGVAVAPKASRQRAANMVGNDLQTTGPPGQMGLNGQDDELVPWLNCPIDDYCSEFLYEFSGVNLNSPSSVVPTERIGSFGQAARDTHGVGNGYGSGAPAGSPEPCRMGNSHLLQPSQRCQDFSPSGRLKEVDPTMCGAHQGTSGGELPPATMQRPDPTTSNLLLPNRSTPLMNFSHFSRPVAMAKANLLGVDRVRGSEKASNVAGGNLMKSTAIESASCLKSASAFHGPLTSVKAKADSNPPVQPSQLMAFVEHSGPICQEDAVKDSGHRNRTDASSNRKFPNHMKYQGPDLYGIEKHETAWKHREPVIASSSVCSANDDGAASDDVKNKAKWKCQEGDASENPSEHDLEDDSTGIKKSVTGQSTSKKRSRAAEVHNLSERRRRDRINEKMRALQELIPNCNKVDKASMLDEAIEYLKTLQMQVQIMSMGGGLYGPPMMLSTGMQHIHPPHMGSFSPMGVGMGMGMGLGFGMGMLDMIGSPLVSMPRMHGPQYACGPIPGTAGLHGMPGSTGLQIFGIPGQAFPMSMPHPPPFVPLTGVSATVNPASEAQTGEIGQVQASDSAPPNSKDQQLNNLEQAAKTSTDDMKAESSRQANRECFLLPSVLGIGNQPPNVGSREAVDSGSGTHLPP